MVHAESLVCLYRMDRHIYLAIWLFTIMLSYTSYSKYLAVSLKGSNQWMDVCDI